MDKRFSHLVAVALFFLASCSYKAPEGVVVPPGKECAGGVPMNVRYRGDPDTITVEFSPQGKIGKRVGDAYIYYEHITPSADTGTFKDFRGQWHESPVDPGYTLVRVTVKGNVIFEKKIVPKEDEVPSSIEICVDTDGNPYRKR